MALTDIAIKKALPRAKLYKLTDTEGLQLHISPQGGKLWRLAYRHLGKQKQLSLGAYPAISLGQARELRNAAKRQLAVGIDPCEQKRLDKLTKLSKADNSFEKIARQWHEHWKSTKNERYANYVITRLESDVFPIIGHRPISEIGPIELVAMVKKIEVRGSQEIARRNYNTCGQIFRYAIAHGLSNRNPVSEVRSSDFMKPRKVENFARVGYKDLPAFLTCIEAYKGSNLTRLAMKLMAFTFLRTSELIGGRWEEIDFENARWVVPKDRMKVEKNGDHVVPLSKQAIETLSALKVLTGHSDLIFPGERDHAKPMSNNTILAAIKRMGYKGKMTGHGFRGLASTILNEAGFNFFHIEAQLAHITKNQVAGAYNHAQYLDQRQKMMQWWADYLDVAKSGKPYPFPLLPK